MAGVKPETFCHWLFECLGAIEGDELADLFAGSGAVTKAWESFFNVPRMAFPATVEPERDSLRLEALVDVLEGSYVPCPDRSGSLPEREDETR